MGLKTFVFSSMGPTDQPSSPPMESPPVQTRTGSDLLATHTLGGGVVGLGLGDAEAAAMIAATTSTTTSTRGRRRRRHLARRRPLVLVVVRVVAAIIAAVVGSRGKGEQKTGGTKPKPAQTAAASASPSPKPTTPPPKVWVASRSDPVRVWTGGDSMGGELGWSVGPMLEKTKVFKPILYYKESSGICRWDFFDWGKQME